MNDRDEQAAAHLRGNGEDKSTQPQQEPQNILREFTAPPFEAGDVPEAIGEYALLFARSAGFCPTATIVAAVVATASMIDDNIRLRVPGASSWFESARLWSVLVAGPAAGKTPAARAMVKPVMDLHRELVDLWSAKNAQVEPEEQEPRPALFTSDCTVEKLCDVLHDNPRGLLYLTDEFESWIGSHDVYRSGSRDRGEWLALYDGGPHQVDRIKRGSNFVLNFGASILTATTPAVLRRLASKLPADGLMQRFIAVAVGRRSERDASILYAQVERAADEFSELLRTLHAIVGPRTVKVGRQARELFEPEETYLRTLTEASESLSEMFTAHIGKHAAMLARVALTFQCAVSKDAPEEISGDTMARAVRFMRKVRHHSLVVYGDMIKGLPSVEVARHVGRFILARGLERVQKRDLTMYVRSFARSEFWVQVGAMNYLCDAGWLTRDDSGYGKPGGTRWTVNPRIHALFEREAEAERERRQTVRELISDATAARRFDNDEREEGDEML